MPLPCSPQPTFDQAALPDPDPAAAADPASVILPQVTFGIAVRMAVMSMLAGA